MIQEQFSWEKLFSDNLVIDFFLLLMSGLLGLGIGSVLPKTNFFQLSAILILLLIPFLGEWVILQLTTISYYGWDFILLSSLLVGVSLGLFNSRNEKQLCFLVLGVGLVLPFILPVNWVLVIGLIAFVILLQKQKPIKGFAALIILLGVMFEPKILLFETQKKYEDRVVFSNYTRKNTLDITTWRKNNWVYIGKHNRMCTGDDWLYHEPMVHPGMALVESGKVLLIGGDTGGCLDELLKYDKISVIDFIPEDLELFQSIRNSGLVDKDLHLANRVNIIESSIFKHLNDVSGKYNYVVVDLPDPTSLENNQYYTKEFYDLCYKVLKDTGTVVTQAGSPYFATKAFFTVGETMKEAGFATVPLHNQILTMGEWGWYLGSKKLTNTEMKNQLMDFSPGVATEWLNNDAMKMMLAFGKIRQDTSGIEINTFKNPVLIDYYTTGNWHFK